MAENHIIHVPSTLDVATLCLHILVPHYHSITLFNPLTISLKLYTIHILVQIPIDITDVSVSPTLGSQNV